MKSGATVRAASYGMAALGAHCQLRPPERPSVSVAAALTRGGEIVAWRPSVRLMGRPERRSIFVRELSRVSGRARLKSLARGGLACAILRAAKDGAPDRIRTYDLCLRRAALYPAELRVQAGSDPIKKTAPPCKAVASTPEKTRDGGFGLPQAGCRREPGDHGFGQCGGQRGLRVFRRDQRQHRQLTHP
jgi:hypothetical protein